MAGAAIRSMAQASQLREKSGVTIRNWSVSSLGNGALPHFLCRYKSMRFPIVDARFYGTIPIARPHGIGG